MYREYVKKARGGNTVRVELVNGRYCDGVITESGPEAMVVKDRHGVERLILKHAIACIGPVPRERQKGKRDDGC